MRARLVGFIPFGARLLNQRQREDEQLSEHRARTAVRPMGNVNKIAGASPQTTARRDKGVDLA